jgi:lactoylglutathione lyase
MKLGVFSVSLSVSDLTKSKEFYENLGFKVFHGDVGMDFLIMKNESTIIGLFHNMFDGNILTFNPGWDENANRLESFEDIREIMRQLKGKGMKLEDETNEESTGPGSFILKDPDGNAILVEQHI